MNKHLVLLTVGLALVLSGCTLAPQYARPPAPVPASWPTGPAYAGNPAPTNATAAPDLQWRTFFTDQKLQQVISLALTNNRDLRLAALNVERARAMYGIQRVELLPTVNIVGSGSRERVPADLSSTGQSQISERYGVDLGVASWELDFFGRIRSLKDHALEEYLGTEQARRSAQILLVSSVAQAYLALAADRENLQLTQTVFKVQKDSYDLIERRYELGLVPELDLYRAQTPVDIARRDIARYEQQVAQNENTLNLLAGKPVPGDLLPAELDQVAPLRDIGAARAAFFPRISLTAAIGTASSDLSGLFKSGSGTWSYTPQIVMPVFDARTWSAHKAAKVQQHIAVTRYEQAIQSAFREVADALALRGTADRQVAAQASLVHAYAESHRLSTSRYDKGIDSYLGVLDAQRSLFAAQQGLVSLRFARRASQVSLYAVLGGGWDGEASSADTAMVTWPQSKETH